MQPFENIRVIDMTHVFAGPFTTYQLAVLGADVIKVEPPGNADMMRIEGADPDLNEQNYGTCFLSQNAGKRAISIDIGSPEGKEAFCKLVKTADVLVENYRGGTLDSFGLGYEALSKINPLLIYCSVTGFGHTGPKASDPAYDTVIQAFSGIMASNGEKAAPPVRVGPPMVDYGTGAQAALAISAALFQRLKTEKGQRIDVSMLDAALMLMSAGTTATQTNGVSPSAHGNAHPSYAGYAAYETKEGMIMLGAWTNRQTSRLYKALGDDHRAERVKNIDREYLDDTFEEDRNFIAKSMMQKSAEEWEIILNKAGVAAARVRQLSEAMAHEQVAGRTVLQTIPGADGIGMPKVFPVAAYSYAHGGPKPAGPPPRIGEHTSEVLIELGYNKDAISEMKQKGVVE